MTTMHNEFEDSPSTARAGATRLRLWATKRILEAGLDTSVVDALLQQASSDTSKLSCSEHASPESGARDGSGTGGAGGSPLRPLRRRRAAAPPATTPSPMCCSMVGSADQNSSSQADTHAANTVTEAGWSQSASSTAPSLREVEFLRDLQAFADRFEHRCRQELQAMHRLADNTMVSLACKVDSKLQTLEEAQTLAGEIASEHCGRVNAHLQEVQQQASQLQAEMEDQFRQQDGKLLQRHLELESELKAARTTAGDIAEEHCTRVNARLLEVQGLCLGAVEEHRMNFQHLLSERFQLQESRMLQRCLQLESEQKAWRESLDDRCSALERRTLRLETRPQPTPTTTSPRPSSQERQLASHPQHIPQQQLPQQQLPQQQLPQQQLPQQQLPHQPVQQPPQQIPVWLNNNRFEVLKLELDARLKNLEHQILKQAQDQTYTTQCLKEIAKLVADRIALADASCARVEARCSSAEERLKQQFQEDSGKVAQDLEALRSGVAKLFDDAETLLKEPLDHWKDRRAGAGSCSSSSAGLPIPQKNNRREQPATGTSGGPGQSSGPQPQRQVSSRGQVRRAASSGPLSCVDEAHSDDSEVEAETSESSGRPPSPPRPSRLRQSEKASRGQTGGFGLCGASEEQQQQQQPSEQQQLPIGQPLSRRGKPAAGLESLQRARSEPRLVVTQGRSGGDFLPEGTGGTGGNSDPRRGKDPTSFKPDLAEARLQVSTTSRTDGDRIPGVLSESPSLTPASSVPSLRRRSSEEGCGTGCWPLAAGNRTTGTRTLARNFSSLDVPPLHCYDVQADEDRRKDRFVVSSEPPNPTDAWSTPSRRVDSRLRTSKLDPSWRMPSERHLGTTPVMRSNRFKPQEQFRVVQDSAAAQRQTSSSQSPGRQRFP